MWKIPNRQPRNTQGQAGPPWSPLVPPGPPWSPLIIFIFPQGDQWSPLVPPVGSPVRRHFSFFALQKRVRWKLDFYTVLKFFCLRRHLYYFLLRKKRSATPHRSSAEALVPRVIEPQRALHWHARGYREGACMQVQNHCPIQIIFPTSLGIPLHFAAKNATRPKQKVPRECSAPGFGTPF